MGESANVESEKGLTFRIDDLSSELIKPIHFSSFKQSKVILSV